MEVKSMNGSFNQDYNVSCNRDLRNRYTDFFYNLPLR